MLDLTAAVMACPRPAQGQASQYPITVLGGAREVPPIPTELLGERAVS